MSDFGLAHELGTAEGSGSGGDAAAAGGAYEAMRGDRALAVRWAAPELLEDGAAAIDKSADIWALGVVFGELTSRGAQPYAGMSNAAVRAHVCGGKRMARPAACPDMLYALMCAMWHQQAAQRPTVHEVGEALTRMWRDVDDGARNSAGLYRNASSVFSAQPPHQSGVYEIATDTSAETPAGMYENSGS